MNSERQEAAPPDLEGFKTDCHWRFVLSARRAELVRRSDGQVLDSRVMTREEVDRELLKSGTKQMARGESTVPIAERQEKPMRDDVRKRAEAEIGQKHGKLTITKITGQHPASGAVLVDAECECGTTINDLLSSITSGRRPCCFKRTCTAWKEEPGQPKARAPRGAGRKKRAAPAKVRKPKPATEATTSDEWRSTLIEEAKTLRRSAVGILKGETTPEDIAEAMRRQADKLDELVYAS